MMEIELNSCSGGRRVTMEIGFVMYFFFFFSLVRIDLFKLMKF